MKGKTQHKNVTKTIDYTTIVDRLTAVIWSSFYNPTGVVKPVYGHHPFH